MDYKPTSLEKVVMDALKARDVEFLAQHPTPSGFVLDIVIEGGIVIEADGPCHDGSSNKRRDRFRDKILKNEGWRIYRLGYELIEDPQKLSQKLDDILSAI